MALSALELGRMSRRVLLIAVLFTAIADPALANWWIVRASDGKCIVVDIEPTGKDKTVTKVGKNSYQTPEQAEADVKRLCKKSKSGDQPAGDSGNPNKILDVCFGSLADIRERIRDVRFAPESGHAQRQNRCLLCAKSGHQPSPVERGRYRLDQTVSVWRDR